VLNQNFHLVNVSAVTHSLSLEWMKSAHNTAFSIKLGSALQGGEVGITPKARAFCRVSEGQLHIKHQYAIHL
jgi:hypothetical protein